MVFKSALLYGQNYWNHLSTIIFIVITTNLTRMFWSILLYFAATSKMKNVCWLLLDLSFLSQYQKHISLFRYNSELWRSTTYWNLQNQTGCGLICFSFLFKFRKQQRLHGHHPGEIFFNGAQTSMQRWAGDFTYRNGSCTDRSTRHSHCQVVQLLMRLPLPQTSLPQMCMLKTAQVTFSWVILNQQRKTMCMPPFMHCKNFCNQFLGLRGELQCNGHSRLQIVHPLLFPTFECWRSISPIARMFHVSRTIRIHWNIRWKKRCSALH